MQEDYTPRPIRPDMLERLKALDSQIGSENLTELAYQRAREALEKALEDARAIRQRASDEALEVREREMTALVESLTGLRAAAEAQIEALQEEARLEADRTKATAEREARVIIVEAEIEAERIRADAERLREEAAILRNHANEYGQQAAQLEADFNELVERMTKRLGIRTKPEGGWWRRLTRK